MTTPLIPLITQAGLQAVFSASNQGLQAEITEVALGDHAWTPEASATGLVSEKRRIAISGGEAVAPNQIHLTAIEDGTDLEYWVNEVGFYLADGTLLAVWSDAQQPLAYKAAGVDLLLAFDMVLSSLPANSISIESTGGLNLAPASTEKLGVVQLASTIQAIDGTDDHVVLTPSSNQAHGDVRYSAKSHRHPMSEIDELLIFEAGTKMVFYQAAAPVGWTQLTDQNDKALRVVANTGGGQGGVHGLSSPPSTAHTHSVPTHHHALPDHSHGVSLGSMTTSNAGHHAHGHTLSAASHTLSSAQMPSHSHPIIAHHSGGGHINRNNNYGSSQTSSTGTGDNTVAQGGGQSHSHGLSGAISGDGGHTHAVTVNGQSGAAGNGQTGDTSAQNTGSKSPTAFKPNYIDVIICQKD